MTVRISQTEAEVATLGSTSRRLSQLEVEALLAPVGNHRLSQLEVEVLVLTQMQLRTVVGDPVYSKDADGLWQPIEFP